MNTKVLIQLRRVVEQAPDDKFDMSVIVDNCGTARCALGWCLVDPWFVSNTSLGKFTGWRAQHSASDLLGPHSLYDTARTLFDLSVDDNDKLFAMDGSADDPYGVGKEPVLDNIERVLAGKPALSYDGEEKFTNYYECPICQYEWTDRWSDICDDDCPSCGHRHVSPYESEDA